MKTHEYQSIYTDLDLSQDQKTLLFNFLDKALDSMGQRDGVAVDYVDAVNSIYRFADGDLESHDEFDDEFTLCSIYYNIDKIRRAINAFESQNAIYADEFKKRAGKLNELLNQILTQEQYGLFMAAMATLFRKRLYFCMNHLCAKGHDDLITNGTHVVSKLSFAIALGVSLGDLLLSCMSDYE